MSHAQGNDLADERRNANTDAANPHTLPPNTGDTDIDEILDAITVTVVYEVGTLPKVSIKTSDAKAAITKNQAEAELKARFIELDLFEQFLNKNPRAALPDLNHYKLRRLDNLEKRLAELQAEETS